MFIPYITGPERRTPGLLRRKGGGGGGHASSGGHADIGESEGSSSKAVASSSNSASSSIKSGSTTVKASASSAGGGAKSTIPANQPFAGRQVGGGTRAEVYGTSTYGSGYPGINGRGVEGRGFPFVFYPVVFSAPSAGGVGYLYCEEEYGNADNTSRPGGPLHQVSFSSSTSTFHIVSDNNTITWLQAAVNNSCHSTNTFTVSSILPYNSSETPYPRPEEAIQYYRASSVVLTLDGYNNTSALGNNEAAPPIPLPSSVDVNLLKCINQTVGTSVFLVNASTGGVPPAVWFIVAITSFVVFLFALRPCCH